MTKFFKFIFLCTLILSSCVDDAKIIGESTPELILIGFCTPDSLITVEVSRTMSVGNPETSNIQDLKRLDIQISINNGSPIKLQADTSFSHPDFVRFVSLVKPEIGDNISIEAHDPIKEFGSVYANTNIPEPAEVGLVDYFTEYKNFPDGEYETYTNVDSVLHFVFSIKDNPISENYYEVYFTNYCAPKGTYTPSRWSGNETIDYYDKVFPPGKIKVFDDSMFDSSPYNMKLSLRGWKRWYWNLLFPMSSHMQSPTHFQLSIKNLTKEGYYYLKSFESNREAMSDIFTEPKTLYSNITGGKGVFIGYSYSHLHLEFISHSLGGLVISNKYISDNGSFAYSEHFKNIM